MKKDIPNIACDKDHELGIEILRFAQLSKKLTEEKSHDPFSFHRLRFYLILVVTEGNYQHYVDFDSYTLKKGSVLFIAENQVQHFMEEGLTKSKGISIIFDNSFFEKSYFFAGKNNFHRLFNYHIEKPIIHQNEFNDEGFTRLAENLYDEFSFPESGNRTDILYAMLKIFLLKAERIKEIQCGEKISLRWIETFNDFKNLLENDFTISRNSRYYSDKLLISYKSLNEIVKKVSNKTVKEFIKDFVTIEIKRYLISTSLSVKEISVKTGFEDPSNLVNFFKKNTGITPIKFRNLS